MTRARHCVLVCVLLIVGVIGLTVFRGGAAPSAAYDRGAGPLGPGPTGTAVEDSSTNDEGPVESEFPVVGLRPADVLGNPDCIMKSGAGPGRDLAVVHVPGEGGSRFAVVDGSGVVFEDALPFHSVRESALARRANGSVLAGFGGADPPWSDSASWQAARPEFGPRVDGVVVYEDGHVIYDHRAASRFGVADDGSSFYVIEPMAGDVARLLIRDLDSGTETHHELANLPPINDGHADIVRYSADRSEVVVQPFQTFHPGRQLEFSFFPTDGGEPRRLSTIYRGLGWTNFVSSNEEYLYGTASRDDLSTVTVKREYRHENGEIAEVDERWSRDLSMGPTSDDGAWLVGYGKGAVHVLDASTGESLFVHSGQTAANHTKHSTRIRDGRLVLGYVIADPDDIARCLSKSRVVDTVEDWKSDGSYSRKTIVDSTRQETCLADLRKRGLYQTVQNVYDLRSLTDGGPITHYKIEYGEQPHCGSGDDPFGTLELRGNQLVYVPRL